MKVKISRMSFGCPLADLRRSKHSEPRYGAQNDNRNNEFCQDAVSHQGNAAIIIPFPDHNFAGDPGETGLLQPEEASEQTEPSWQAISSPGTVE
jgi:hypothetical protein